MRKSTPGIDPTSQTFADAKGIMAEDAPNSKALRNPSGGSPKVSTGLAKLDSIRMEPCENGCTVTHRDADKPGEKGEELYSSSKNHSNVFAGPNHLADAHAHIGKLMGLSSGSSHSGGGLT